jgi:hypothetical protein
MITSSLFGDNRGSITITRGSKVSITNSTLFGKSSSFQLIQKTKQNVEGNASLCNDGGAYAGIQLFPATPFDFSFDLEDIKISGFGVDCFPYAFKVNPDTLEGLLEGAIAISNSGGASFDFCSISSGIGNVGVFVVDKDSRILSSSDTTNPFPSTLVPNSHPAIRFLPPDIPIELPKECASYLMHTCLRTVIFFVDPKGTDNLSLRICDRASMSTCVSYNAIASAQNPSPKLHQGDDGTRMNVFLRRYFLVNLPNGRFQADFFDTNTNDRVWPTHVEEHWGAVSCAGTDSGYLEEGGSIWLPIPPIPSVGSASGGLVGGVCMDNLIRPEPVTDGITEDTKYWIGNAGGLQVISALSSSLICEKDPSLATARSNYILGQYLDTRCLVEQQEYTVSLNIRFRDDSLLVVEEDHGDSNATEDADTAEALILDCSSSEDSLCPEVGILFKSHDGRKSWVQNLKPLFEAQFQSSANPAERLGRIGQPRPRSADIFSIGNGIDGRDGNRSLLRGQNPIETRKAMAALADAIGQNSFHFESTLLLDYEMAGASSAFFFVKRPEGSNGVNLDSPPLCVDSVMIRNQSAVDPTNI